jgi:DNA invertase Pin-like site-specific DNA recombinase
MYLRKSRQDDPNETVEEVLAKHEGILQEWAMRELGREIPEEYIFREVVSGGESIDERVEMQKVLAMIESPMVAGVLVVDPQRLTRSSLQECGRFISLFKYSSTLVATPMMVYDLSNKMECKFFETELMRGRDYLDYIKEILSRGRTASIRKGNFIGSKPPFGYDKVTIGKDHTLVPNKDADVVRMIFDWYVNERIGYKQISNRLDEMGVKPVYLDKWNDNTIGQMLKNIQYDGKVCYGRKKTVTVIKDGEQKTCRPLAPKEDIIIVEGKHPAIVDHDLFMAAQDILNNHPRLPKDKALQNPLAGIAKCATCGRALFLQKYGGARTPRIECRSKPNHFKTVIYTEVEAALLFSLESSELPQLEALQKNNAGNSVDIQEKLIKRLEEEMKGYHAQEETQYEMLETRRYTPEVFDLRNAALRQKMSDCEERLKKARQALPNAVNYEEKIIQLKDAISALKDTSLTPEEKNRRLKTIVEKVAISTTDKGHKKTDIHLKVFLKI